MSLEHSHSDQTLPVPCPCPSLCLTAPTHPGPCLLGCFLGHAWLVLTNSEAVTIRHLTLVSRGTGPERGEWEQF